METLPVEIADKIFNEIFHENPRGLYALRRVSKTWSNMIDRCTARLLKVWCNKCSNEFPENYLDDFVGTRLSQSWQEYCSYKLAVPHIARDIYDLRNEIPNLVGKAHFTEICSNPNLNRITSYAVNGKAKDRYAVRDILCIYSLNDLTHCIREYPFFCIRLDFYTTDNQVFILLRKANTGNYTVGPILLAEFLVNDNLIPANLLIDDRMIVRYKIIKNECFTYNEYSDWFQHHRLTSNGFEPSTRVQLSFPPGSKVTEIKAIQICNRQLLVSVLVRKSLACIYKYGITKQPNGELLFSDPEVYEKKSHASQPLIYFASDTISLPNSICDFHPYLFYKWSKKFFQQDKINSITIYSYHVLLTCIGKIIIFRGSLQQLMDYVVKKANPGSKCTAIDLNINLPSRDYVRIIPTDAQPRFLVFTKDKVFTVDLIP